MTAIPPAIAAKPPLPQAADDQSPAFLLVCIGASAGGLEACSKLMDVLPPASGMAFILVQHLDPTHASMMAELLTAHTKMAVLQAGQGMLIHPDHLYIIPPGNDQSVAEGRLQLSQPLGRHGARLPFDVLLHSVAASYGARTVCIVLSGSGADGSLGLRAVKERHGLVIAQLPSEAGHPGMPESAIQTGAVDLVLSLAEMPLALARFRQNMATKQNPPLVPADAPPPNWFTDVIDLLRTRTPYDFSLYKSGTLTRRIHQRMATLGIAPEDGLSYSAILRTDGAELDRLAADLLINVTQFFRDMEVFSYLENMVLPDLIRGRGFDQPLRVWVAGCSMGEETYSLLMLFREEISRQGLPLKLQFFASDVDPEAVSSAREGLYPKTIAADVSAERLARFFTEEDDGYRVLPELRAAVVFAVHDVLVDPPFSRIDFVSCRNLLIYFGTEAQTRVVSLFRFALRPNGLLLLGTAETAGALEGRFEILSKPARLYRRTGRNRPGEFGFLAGFGDSVRDRSPPGVGRPAAAKGDLGALIRTLLLENYAPAAILINRRHECLYLFGPTERYLRPVKGRPTHNLLDMIRPDLRTKLRSAIKRAPAERASIVLKSGRAMGSGLPGPFQVEIRPIPNDGDELLLVTFVDEPGQVDAEPATEGTAASVRLAEIERELETTREELRSTIQDLERSSEEQTAINEEALSVNEEYQSTNEELLTSKEELQSLNEELTALNSQLQETLERQRTTSDDLQNVLYSTDVATVFLDTALKIRLFTPATRALFAVIPGDVGRPLADLRALAPDAELISDARAVLAGHAPIEHEAQTPDGIWFRRRILPYRTHINHMEGVVITFTDITKRKSNSKALEEAKHEAEQATIAKSRFLAAASHDLRQPLQTLTLLHGLLTKTITGEREQGLLARMDQTVDAMAGMLNALLDINQIEAGVIQPEITIFAVNDILERMRDAFTYHAEAKRLTLHVVPCSQWIASDQRLLEQMIRNLVANALKYTKEGKVLLGCRMRGGILRIEIWDTGIGIPAAELQSIFDEYHQIGNKARERSLGLGLGLSIVQRLGSLLGHRVKVASRHGQGSVFTIEVGISSATALAASPSHPSARSAKPERPSSGSRGTILVVEDDPHVRELLEVFLRDEGHDPIMASDGPSALQLILGATIQPDLVLADYNLPNDMEGLRLADQIRERLGSSIPIVILTGDISSDTLREIHQADCMLLNKPVKLDELTTLLDGLVGAVSPVHPDQARRLDDAELAKVYIVDDDDTLREAISAIVVTAGGTPIGFASGEAFLKSYQPSYRDCLLVDAYLPGMNGIALLRALDSLGQSLPAVMITGNSDVTMAVAAMKAGASDFLEKPVKPADILAGIRQALARSHDEREGLAWKAAATARLAQLTPRQHEVMHLVLQGLPSKNIAADLAISQRTVESHRAAIMKKTGSASLPALARLVMAAAWTVSGG